MNKEQMHQIFAHYIDNFEMINNKEHEEYYKWQVCAEFKNLMDDALGADTEDFADALYKVKVCSANIIDSYTQPFYGLVELARKEPETVQQMFSDLYSDDKGNVKVQMQLIKDFFDQCSELLDKYYPDSYLYKQNSHSVSSYLFLYDPDHHYMYKATQSQVMADCIEFYDDWGTGDNIKLDVYYRMCDEILAGIKACPELLKTNSSRYDGELKLNPGKLHEDKELHILLFDIIYCSHVYNLFDGITFARPKSKEKQLIVEQKNKAKSLLAAYDEAKLAVDNLDEALMYFASSIKAAGVVNHKMYGECEVIAVDPRYLKLRIVKSGEEKLLGLSVVIANGIISLGTDEFKAKKDLYLPLLKKGESVPRALEYAAKALEPYKEYLD
ncbi:MAG: hypothetical protein Q4E51_10585 [Lachnospiraceae bacterium]|nr:hypothetical protein [Lachnospiraceae bacterium]